MRGQDKNYRDKSINISDFEDKLNFLNLTFDLIIDDGLHSVDANLGFLIVALKFIKKNGWIVIEDIGGNTLVFWNLISKILENRASTRVFKSEGNGYIFTLHNDKELKC